ncbi:MAG: hypothetical protein HC892_23810 [Saprospiraceae bacterium]|nr:hypothetical protein [Saprospiraceae bacterium]
MKTIRIKVVGPPPENVTAASRTGQVFVTWEKPYACEITENEFFRGFSIWRREGSNPFEQDTCTTGLEGRGYRRLAFDQMRLNADGSRYEFIDTDVERGRTYCYRILAEFARTSPLGNFPYNRVASIPSQEVCIQLSRDIPLITNVDVLTTGSNNGRINIAWSKPNAIDLDTIQNPPPYRYQLFRANGIDGTDFTAVPNASFVSATFAAANDTIFIDAPLNTVTQGYNYKVAFYVNGEAQAIGETQTASSIFLTVAPTDKANNLSWQANVPWINIRYIVYLVENGIATALDTIAESQYQHVGLENGTNYCYVIESIGSYGVEGIINPILNTSQQACATPLDNVPPCPPQLNVVNICGDVQINFHLQRKTIF